MKHRKRAIRITIGVIVLVGVVGILLEWSRPGPGSPEWWLERARNEARKTMDFGIHHGIIEAYCKMGKLDLARDTAYEHMNPYERSWVRETMHTIRVKTRLKKPKPGPPPIKVTSGKVIGRPRHSPLLSFLSRKSTSTIWSDVAVAQAKAGDMAAAKASAAGIAEPHRRARTYCDMALAFTDEGDANAFQRCVELAKTAAEEMTAEAAVQSNSLTFYTVISEDSSDLQEDSFRNDAVARIAEALAKGGRTREARATAETIKNEVSRCRAYCRIADALAEKADIEGAREYLRLARSVAVSVTSPRDRRLLLARIAGALAVNGDVEEARTIARSSQADVLYEDIAGALAEAGKTSDAPSFAGEIRNEEDRSRAYCAIAKALVRAGDIPEARRMIATIAGADNCSDVYRLIARWHARYGRIAACERSIARAAAAADELLDPISDAYAFADLARICADNADMTGFWKFITKAKACAKVLYDPEAAANTSTLKKNSEQPESLRVNAHQRATAWGFIVRELSNAGAFEQALALARAFPEDWEKASACAGIAEAQADAGKFEAAWTTAEDIPADGTWRRNSYEHIAAAQARAGKIEELKRRIESMKRRYEFEAGRLGPGPASWLRWHEIRCEVAHAYLGAAKGLIEKQKATASSQE